MNMKTGFNNNVLYLKYEIITSYNQKQDFINFSMNNLRE
jgi:hypothetical protein